MTDASFISDMAVALLAALVAGGIAARLKLPVVIGYLIAGILVGPYTPGFMGDMETIKALAEIGVVLLMFGVGVDFSIDQLRNVRNIALFGGGGQVLITILFGIGIGVLLGWPWSWNLFFGCILALASTTVLLKLLMERGEMGSQHGQIMVGVSLLQDLSTILMVTLLPALTVVEAGSSPLLEIGKSLALTVVFLGIMFLLGSRLFPWLLTTIAQRGSREMFLLSTVALSIGTAFVATHVFELSLALGAFIAGLVVSESEVHYRIMSDLLPVRDIFAVVFFVSVGMLINPMFLWENIGVVLLVSAAIVGGKFIIATLVTWPFAYSRRTLLLAAAGLAQIGEFSFILAQQGLQLGVLDDYIYSLTLSGALLSTLAVPFLMRGAGALGGWLDSRSAPPSSAASPMQPCQPLELQNTLRDHVVICGYGRVTLHIVEAMEELRCSFVVIEHDWLRAQQVRRRGAHVIYGDATSSLVLEGAQLTTARIMVVAIPELATQRMVVYQAHTICPELPIIARARQADELALLYGDGASEVIVPSFEGGMEMLRQTLLRMQVSAEAIQNYIDAVHFARYEPWRQDKTDTRVLSNLRSVSASVDMQWYYLTDESMYVGQTIGMLNVRQHTGASIVAIVRGNSETMINPAATITLCAGDRLAVVGTDEQRHGFIAWLRAGEERPPVDVDGDGVSVEQI